MRKGTKNPHTPEWNKKISEGVKRQHAEGRGRSLGFTLEQRQRAYQKTWRGENVSKSGLHQWVRRWKGEPLMCQFCGTTEKRKYEWANLDHSYKRNLDDYIRLCTSCHRNYDIACNNYCKCL